MAVERPSTVVKSGLTQEIDPSAPLTNCAPATASENPIKLKLLFSSYSNKSLLIVTFHPTSPRVPSG